MQQKQTTSLQKLDIVACPFFFSSAAFLQQNKQQVGIKLAIAVSARLFTSSSHVTKCDKNTQQVSTARRCLPLFLLFSVMWNATTARRCHHCPPLYVLVQLIVTCLFSSSSLRCGMQQQQQTSWFSLPLASLPASFSPPPPRWETQQNKQNSLQKLDVVARPLSSSSFFCWTKQKTSWYKARRRCPPLYLLFTTLQNAAKQTTSWYSSSSLPVSFPPLFRVMEPSNNDKKQVGTARHCRRYPSLLLLLHRVEKRNKNKEQVYKKLVIVARTFFFSLPHLRNKTNNKLVKSLPLLSLPASFPPPPPHWEMEQKQTRSLQKACHRRPHLSLFLHLI